MLLVCDIEEDHVVDGTTVALKLRKPYRLGIFILDLKPWLGEEERRPPPFGYGAHTAIMIN